jgi:hypothetical protein
MANRFWVGNNSSLSWTNTNNWAAISGGAGGQSVPTYQDAVTFDAGGSGDCTLDANAQMASWNIAAGYSGTFDASTFSLLSSGNTTFTSSNATVNMGSGKWRLYGNFDWFSQGNLTHETAKVISLGTGTYKSPAAGDNIYDWTIASGVQVTLDVAGGTLTVDNNFSIQGTGTFNDITFAGVNGFCEIGPSGAMNGSSIHGISQNCDLYFYPTSDIDERIYWLDPVAGQHVQDGTYKKFCKVYDTSSGTWVWELGSGEYYFPLGIEFESNNYDITIDMGTNDTKSFTSDLTILFDLNGTSDIIVDNSGGSVDWILGQSMLREQASTGSMVWNKGSGKIRLVGSLTQTVDVDGESIETIELESTAAAGPLSSMTITSLNVITGTWDFNDQEVTVLGDLDAAAGTTLIMGAGNNVTVGGNWDTRNISVTEETSKVIFDGTGVDLITQHNDDFWNFEIAPGASVRFPSVAGTRLNVNNNCDFKGDFNIGNNQDFYCKGVTRGFAGSEVLGSGELRITDFGAGQGWVAHSGTVSVNEFTFSLNSNKVAFPIGQYDCTTFLIRNGTGSNGFVFESGNCTFTNNFNILNSFNNWLEVDCRPVPKFTIGGDVYIETRTTYDIDMVCSGAQVDWDIGGDFVSEATVSTGELNWKAGSGVIELTGSTAKDIEISNQNSSLPLDNLRIRRTGSTLTFTGDVYALSYIHTNGAVDFNTQTLTTDNEMIIHGPSGASLQSGDNGMDNVSLLSSGDFIVTGQVGARINLQGSAGWTLQVNGDPYVDYVFARGSNAAGAATIIAEHSVNNGSNTNWKFLVEDNQGFTLHTAASASRNNNIDLYTGGLLPFNGNIDLFASGDEDVFIADSGNLPLFVHGQKSYNNDIDLYTAGPIPQNVNIPLFLHNPRLGRTIPGTQLGINFLVYPDVPVEINLNNRELGFFGDNGSEDTLEVGQWNGTTYLVDLAEGTGATVQVTNLKYHSSTKVLLEGISEPILLTQVPNWQASLNIKFKNTEAVRTFFARCKLFDRVDADNPPIGVNAKLAEIIHTGKIQKDQGEGDTTWQDAGSGQWLDLSNSPGESGQYAGVIGYRASEIHDWYLALSVSPKPIGRRTGDVGLYVELEYL